MILAALGKLSVEQAITASDEDSTNVIQLPAQDYVGKFLTTFKEYPARQKAASFNLDEVMKKLEESGGSK